jgi:autotransporter-associated beta strand protein
LTVNGSLATSGNVIVQSGAILTGVGTVGTVYVYAGGTLATGTNGSGTLTTSSVELFADDLLDYTLGTGIPGLDGLVSCSDTVGLVGGVIVNVTAGVNWGNGMFPLFNLLSLNFPSPVTFDAGWTILGANLGGHIYDLVATGNYLDLNVQAVAGVWSAAGGGAYSWGTAGNWQGGVAPNAVGDTAVLGTVVGSGAATITLNGAQTLSSLTFSPGAGGSYVLSGSGANSLQLANDGSSASVSVTGGSDAINAPVVLDGDPTVTVASGTSLVISGAIGQSGGSEGLSLSGGGTLTVSGDNSYSGGTTVANGTLSVSSAQALPSAGVLVVGRSGRVVLGNTVGSAATIAASSPVASSDATTSGIATAAVTVAASPASDGSASNATTTSDEASAAISVATTDARATPVAVAAAPASVTHDAVFNATRLATVVAPPSVAASVPSQPTETVRVAALGGIVLRSAALSKPGAGKSVFGVPASAMLVSGVSTDTQGKIASLIDAVPALPSVSSVAVIVTPSHGSHLGRVAAVHKAPSTAVPQKGLDVRFLARAPNGLF